mgnify:CR=1 FL=1
MTLRTGNLIGVLVMFATAIATAAEPAAGGSTPSTKSDPDRLVIDALKDVHNKGAELYNAGDSPGCYRMYQGALLAVRPFLAHRPAIQKAIDDGLADVAKTEGVKIQAFRLHEVIEDVRGKLKDEIKRKDKDKEEPKKDIKKDEPKKEAGKVEPKPEAPKKEPEPKKVEPAPEPKPIPEASLGGAIALDGKPLLDVEVTIVSQNQSPPHFFSAAVTPDARYAFDAPLPLGSYVLIVTPGLRTSVRIPGKYQSAKTSDIRVTLEPGANTFDVALASK